jgi:hypothetical protein
MHFTSYIASVTRAAEESWPLRVAIEIDAVSFLDCLDPDRRDRPEM